MTKIQTFFIFLLSFAASLEIAKALAITPEILVKAKVNEAQALNKSQALEQQAQQLYETGRFAEAIALLQQAYADYVAQGNELRQAMVLRNLALVYQGTGEWSKASEAIADNLKRVSRLEDTREHKQLLAQILDVQGQLQLSLGQSEQALDTWKRAATTYKQIGDVTGVTRGKINQAQALQALGLYRQAIKTLTEVKENLQNQPDSLLKARGLQSLGEALRVVGDLNQSQKVLQQSLAIAEKLQVHEAIAATLLSLGNTAKIQHDTKAALNFYQRALLESPSLVTQIEAQMNQLSLLVEKEQWSDAKVLIPQIKSKLAKLPPSRKSIYARINLARNLMKMERWGDEEKVIERVKRRVSTALEEHEKVYKANQNRNNITHQSAFSNPQSPDVTDAAQLLATAIQQSQNLKDKRAEAYALGSLGKLYEQSQQLRYARELTEKALLLTQSINASDIAYQWQWQLGRILKVQGEREGAIAAYTQAVNTLQSLRSDLVAISSDVQFSFRENVEPVYRELVGLLLPLGVKVDQKALIQARKVIELLQLAELDNFFRDACLDAKPAQIDQIDRRAAVFYTIILSDRLEVILALPGQPLRHYTTALPQSEIEANLKKMQDALIVPRARLTIKPFLEPSKQVYDWLIRPTEADLAASDIKNLVFVLDGSLRNIPLAALYDGQQYLVQKYSVALTPGLQLVDSKPLPREQLKVLTAGLTEARQDFQALPNVKFELERIKGEVPTQVLLNQSFTNSNFQAAIKSSPFPVVHLATHGEFSSQAKDTFILTWDGKINATELDSLLRTDIRQRNPIELLVLSACQTAVGDKRAALGLAGVAVRAGARSTLASLWYVNDRATAKLMTKFYQELTKNQVTKAEALRRAQLAVLQDDNFSHPYFWAAFVLVGNWL